jgi:hypothetical protein
MVAALDQSWADAVCSACDPVFESADVGFVRQVQRDPRGRIDALLWEADPRRFAQRYPDSGIINSYGLDQWPPYCIDYWVYVDADAYRARINVEGWNFDEEVLDLSGDGRLDGVRIGAAVARILKVPPPRH